MTNPWDCPSLTQACRELRAVGRATDTDVVVVVRTDGRVEIVGEHALRGKAGRAWAVEADVHGDPCGLLPPTEAMRAGPRTTRRRP